MTSKDTDDSQDALINLIYRHLKDNGYEKAANVLRKHAPQVETEQVKESLSEIFEKWTSERKRHKKAGKDTCSSSESSDSEVSHLPPELGQKAPVGTNIRKTGSKKQKNKETLSKPRRKSESGEDLATGNSSDSDSSLDVEKWTKLVSQLSEADIAKMEVLSNFVESPVSSPGKSTNKRQRQTKPKKETNRAPAIKAKATADDISVQTEGTKISSKKSKAHKPAVDHQTNGLLVTSPSTEAADLSDSENIRSPKKVKSSNSLSEQVETSTAKMADLNSETSSCETLSKKGKRKKVERQSESTHVQTPPETTDNTLSDTKVRKNKKASKPAEADCDEGNLDTHLLSDQSETPSKKVKNKKAKSAEEPVPYETPKKHKAKKTKAPADLDNATTSEKAESSDPDSPSHKNKHHEGNRLSEAEESETPSRKSKKAKNVIAEPGQLDKPHKKPKMDSSDETLLQSDPTKGSLKKRKSKASSDGVEARRDGLSETEFTKSPIKSRKSEATTGGDDDDDGLGNEESSGQDLKTPSKKRKHKREETNDVPAQEEATPEPKKNKKEKRKNKDAEDAIEDLEQPPEEALVTIATDQKKKKKKKEKERESEETLADDPPVWTAAEEEIIHKKKKKSSKEKHLGSDEAPGFNGTEQ